MSLTPAQFIENWKNSKLGENRNGNAAPQHFIQLCQLLGEPTPQEADPKGEWYCFEKGAARTTGTRGWADVWKRGHFGWEYKGPEGDLTKAYDQLKSYAGALENPPLLVVSDTKRIIIHTNWTNAVTETHEIELEDLTNPHNLQILKWLFTDPERLRPSKTIQALTDEAAKKFAKLALQLRERGHKPEEVAHFINRLAFCMFAEDVNLLPKNFFTSRLYTLVTHPERVEQALKSLFKAMSQKDGMYGDEPIAWFNGGLFEDDKVLPLTREDLALLHEAAKMDWEDIDPSIFGTLFERGLDPAKRSQLGAHYTDAAKIEMIIDPVISQPLMREWEDVKASIEAEMGRKTTSKAAAVKSAAKAKAMRDAFIAKLREFKVLDPACGSGNFLYLALKSLKDIELKAYIDTEGYFPRPNLMETGPHNMLGIELNSYAAELARMTVWIGEIQWCLKHGWQIKRDPILQSLKTITNHDALINPDGSEYKWPKANVIIGNPPFLGSKKQKEELSPKYIGQVRKVYSSIAKGSNFVCYWFLKSYNQLESGNTQLAGLVSTTAIKQKYSQKVMEEITTNLTIYNAYSDEEWAVDGAAVRVSLICFAKNAPTNPFLDGQAVGGITSKLKPLKKSTASYVKPQTLTSNKKVAFTGTQKTGPFEISGNLARVWLQTPSNPNGRKNSDVLKHWSNGQSLVKIRPTDTWIIDFGAKMSEKDAAFYEAPFDYVMKNIKPLRDKNNDKNRRENYWLHAPAGTEMRKALTQLSRYIITPFTSKHRIYIWKDLSLLPDISTVAIAREDDVAFGILSSRHHDIWALYWSGRMGKGNDPRYTVSTTFETFPFPKGLEPNRKPSEYDNPHAQAIADAAKTLNELRERWLNPPELVDILPEVVEGYPDRILPKNEKAAGILKNRTLTKLYNENPAWLQNAHANLNIAVSQAYGWENDMKDDEILAELLKRNTEQ
ncbi:MAG: class I SAM-dependent DNA methyltransferase [Alphaproteobacteria bacterium CG_4_10_14_0_8_um_filter_53_9]|nr:MAG: class I SAM-dependent DNA methyltransferase [Alphaproteobacteria bacterium CG_4_10_14_0_8_um_filter_53_9]